MIIMRHAKSVVLGSTTDHDRPLSDKGKEEAPQTALALSQQQWSLDFVLCSDAQRTIETWELMQPILGKIPIQFTRELYQASVQQVLALIQNQKNNAHTLLILGHNPTSEALIEWLSTEIVDLGTANAALLECTDVNGTDIFQQKGKWNLKQIITPSNS